MIGVLSRCPHADHSTDYLLFDRMDQAVDRMSKILLGTDQSVAANSLQRVLFGLSPPSRLDDVGEIQWFNENGLNPSQKKAVKLALASPEIALIHGPPGVCEKFLFLS